MKGWFDAFRNDGGPTLYTYSNRTPVTGDVNTISILLVFSTLLVAFLVIFPGVRKQRFTTFLSVVLSLYIGTVILAANLGSTWHMGTTEVRSPYSAYSPHVLHAQLGAYIGLTHVNITLKVIQENNETQDIDFNERFYWIGSHQMGNSYKESLRRGLPFPILTVAEYLSFCQEGFNWGAHYRAAGYYASVTLWAALACWVLMNLLLISVPRYGAYTMTVTGTLMLLSTFIYWKLLPSHQLKIRLEASELSFQCGPCFYIVLYSGIICTVTGFIIAVVDCIFPHKFSTILEVDYDTPYDRHIIIEDSTETRDKKKQSNILEKAPEPGFPSKLLRRLSRRSQLDGIVNDNFEMDAPKSPWRYPFRPTAFPALNAQTHIPDPQQHSPRLLHSPAQLNGHGRLSPAVLSRDVGTDPPPPPPLRNHIQLSRPPIKHPKYPFNRQMSTDSHESVASDHSNSSLGLSFINRIRESTRIPPSPLAGPPRRGSNESKNEMWSPR